jgi:hypothetical protein
LLQLDFVGAGGEMIVVESDIRSDDLVALIEETAAEIKAPLAAQEAELTLPSEIVSHGITAWALFGWQDAAVSPETDTLETIDSTKLQQFGELFALVLTKLARETQY